MQKQFQYVQKSQLQKTKGPSYTTDKYLGLS